MATHREMQYYIKAPTTETSTIIAITYRLIKHFSHVSWNGKYIMRELDKLHGGKRDRSTGTDKGEEWARRHAGRGRSTGNTHQGRSHHTQTTATATALTAASVFLQATTSKQTPNKMKLASGHEVEELEAGELAQQMKDFTGYADGLVRLNPGRWLFPKPFLLYADKYFNFEFRPSDVVIDTYPKCGTTWMQEIVWTMKHNPDMNHPLAALPVLVRSPFLEMDCLFSSASDSTAGGADDRFLEGFKVMCPGRDPKDGMCLQMAECTEDPRIIKTHLPLSLLPPSLLDTCKMVYVARNPKDMVVSYHHHSRLINVHGYRGTWEQFVEYFITDDLIHGSYALNLKEAWEQRNHPNMHFIFFEDMKADVMGELKRLDAFLGTNLTPQQLDNVARHTSFKEMQGRDSMGTDMDSGNVINTEVKKKSGGFFRKGEAGDWKDKFDPELMAKVDAWIDKNIKTIGMDFKYSV